MKQLLKSLLLFTIKSFIACSILFTFLSVFIFNLQIQNHQPNGNLSGFTDIVQVDLFTDNLKAYFFEQ
mgnify:CR=1 FL=1